VGKGPGKGAGSKEAKEVGPPGEELGDQGETKAQAKVRGPSTPVRPALPGCALATYMHMPYNWSDYMSYSNMKCDGCRLPRAHVSLLFDLLHTTRDVTPHRVGQLALPEQGGRLQHQ
jgi:hypothetical protein